MPTNDPLGPDVMGRIELYTIPPRNEFVKADARAHAHSPAIHCSTCPLMLLKNS
jgi:hypothetical protein